MWVKCLEYFLLIVNLLWGFEDVMDCVLIVVIFVWWDLVFGYGFGWCFLFVGDVYEDF